MKKIFRVLVLLVFATNVSCAKKVNVKWQGTEVLVDGDASDWSVPLQFYDSKSKLNYAISNDGGNLYFAFRLTEMDVINQFNFGGITIELDTLPGKSLSHMLKYPSGGRPMPKMGEDMENPDVDRDNIQKLDERPTPPEDMSLMPSFITLKGISTYRKEVTIALEELEGVEAAHQFDMDNQVLFCEIKVPFGSLEMNPKQLINLDNIFKIKMSLGNGGGDHPAPPEGGGQTLQGPPPGGGNPPMGGGPGGGRPDGPPDMQNGSSKKQEIAFEFRLASQP